MSDSSPPTKIRPLVPWQLVLMGALGAAAPAGLAAAGLAPLVPALDLSVVMIFAGGLAIAWSWRAPRADPAQRAAAPPVALVRQPPFAIMLEHLIDPILLIAGGDPADLGDRRFVYANGAARDLLHIQRSDGPLTTAVRAPEILAAVEGALFGEGPRYAVYETRGVAERFWRVSVIALTGERWGEGSERLALLTLRDETEIRRSERTRADFLANASHELRTPLASLAGFVETLRGHARDDPEARERFLGIMQAQAERMRRLIDDLTSLSRIELGEHIPPSGRVDMATAVVDVVDALAPIAVERQVSLRSILPPPDSAIALGDRDQILQVIQNLAENALKYTPVGHAVVLEVMSDLEAGGATTPVATGGAHLSLVTPDNAAGKRYVAVRVRDVGPGIARGNLVRLTERFYRVEGQKVDRSGTGLGLAIVKHIINRHRGGLTVESTEGAGSVFTAYVPQIQGPAYEGPSSLEQATTASASP